MAYVALTGRNALPPIENFSAMCGEHRGRYDRNV
jgi:hypothetical protein